MPLFICHCHSATSRRLSLPFFLFLSNTDICFSSPCCQLLVPHLLTLANHSLYHNPFLAFQSSLITPVPSDCAMNQECLYAFFRVQTWLVHTQKQFQQDGVKILFVSVEQFFYYIQPSSSVSLYICCLHWKRSPDFIFFLKTKLIWHRPASHFYIFVYHFKRFPVDSLLFHTNESYHCKGN